MHTQPPTPQTIRFEGQKSWGQGDIDSVVFTRLIDKKPIATGAHITVTRPHQGSFTPLQDPAGPNAFTGETILLKGKIVGLSSVKDGEALYTVRNDLDGKLTIVRVPTMRTNIDLEGGWTWMAKPLWGANGLLLRYPALVSTRSLRGPGASRTDAAPSDPGPRDL